MTPALEKVARAIYEAAPIWDLRDLTEGPGKSEPIPWERAWEHNCELVDEAHRRARAALESLLRPSEEVVEAMAKAEFSNVYSDEWSWEIAPESTQASFIEGAEQAFTAAIKSILGEDHG